MYQQKTRDGLKVTRTLSLRVLSKAKTWVKKPRPNVKHARERMTETEVAKDCILTKGGGRGRNTGFPGEPHSRERAI